MRTFSLIKFISLSSISLIASAPAFNAYAESITVRQTIDRSGEPAGENNPRCSSKDHVSTADKVIEGIGGAIDSYIGVPLVETAISDERIRNFIKVGLGTHKGPSRCATLCLTVPKGSAVTLTVGAHQNGGGKQQWIGPWEGRITVGNEIYPGIDFSKFERVTKASSEKTDVYCTVAKNWRASYSRDMWLRADY